MLTEGAVGLRNLRAGDAELFLRWWNDPEVMRSVGYPNGLGLDLEQVEKELRRDSTETEAAKSTRFVIVRLEDELPIGELNYSGLDSRNRKVSVGIKICNVDARGRGYASSALKALLRFLFDSPDMNKVELDTFASNHAARCLYERAGFQLVGVKEQDCYSATTGRLEDVALYEILRQRWELSPLAS